MSFVFGGFYEIIIAHSEMALSALYYVNGQTPNQQPSADLNQFTIVTQVDTFH